MTKEEKWNKVRELEQAIELTHSLIGKGNINYAFFMKKVYQWEKDKGILLEEIKQIVVSYGLDCSINA